MPDSVCLPEELRPGRLPEATPASSERRL